MPAATKPARSTALTASTGTAEIGTLKLTAFAIWPVSGASTPPSVSTIAATFSSPATQPNVVTARYFAVTMLVLAAGVEISVSHVPRSRSPAVLSMAGKKQPTETMTTKNNG